MLSDLSICWRKNRIIFEDKKLGQRLFLGRAEQALKDNLKLSFLRQNTYKDVEDTLCQKRAKTSIRGKMVVGKDSISSQGEVHRIPPCFLRAILDFVENRLHKVFCHARKSSAQNAYLISGRLILYAFLSLVPGRACGAAPPTNLRLYLLGHSTNRPCIVWN